MDAGASGVSDAQTVPSDSCLVSGRESAAAARVCAALSVCTLLT